MTSKDILIITVAICLLIFTISKILNNYIIPSIKEYIAFKKINDKYDEYNENIRYLINEIKSIRTYLDNLSNTYKDYDELEINAVKAADSIVNLIVGPTILKKRSKKI